MYNNKAYQLKYAKAASRIIISCMYENALCPRLERKYKKVYTALAIEDNHNNSARVL